MTKIKWRTERRYVCMGCGEIRRRTDWLRARNPFQEDEWIDGCPACKSIDPFERICDADGCTSESLSVIRLSGVEYAICERHIPRCSQ